MSARRLFLLLAPFAAVLGMFLAYRHSTASYLGLAITRSDVVRIAREQAAARGVKADGWNELVDLQPNNDLRHYLGVSAPPDERLAVERIVSPVVFRCTLENEANASDSVHVTVSPAGRLLSYRVPPLPPTASDARHAKITEAQARQAAEQELRTRLGAESAGFVPTGMGGKRHEATSSDIRQFTFRRQYGKELSIESSIDTSGGKVIGFKLVPRVSPEHEKRFVELSLPFNVVRGIGIMLLVAAAVVYITARFVKRSREHEVPLKRAAIVAAIVFVAFAFTTMVGRETQRINTLGQGYAGSTADAVMMIVFAMVMGAIVGVTWGACEADLREVYPEKLTSADALLGGLFQSRALRSSLSIGLALGGYAMLLYGLEAFFRARLGVWATIASGELMPYQSAWPGLVVLMFAFSGLPVVLGFMLAAVSATHRKGRSLRGQVVLAVLVLLFYLLSVGGNYTPLAWMFVQTIFAAAILLVPFLIGDVLALIIVNMVSAWAVLSASLIAQPAPMFRSAGWTMMAILAVLIAAAVIAAFRRRDSTGAEVEAERPEYARNIAERLMLTTEMDAARQAQLRVMPRVVPNVEGVWLAATHSASTGIGTDYYEFFPSATHLGVAVADARLPGLSSALCISMLKGLLLNYAARLTDPRDLADRVYRQLSSIFGDDLPVSFFFGRLDRSTGAFAFAMFGAAPHAILVRAGGVTSLEGEEYVELEKQSGDAVVIYNARLGEMRDRDGAVLGEDAIRAELSRAGSSDPHALSGALFELATRHARGAGLDQPWTAVAIAPGLAEVRP